jgi:hypothetical protein
VKRSVLISLLLVVTLSLVGCAGKSPTPVKEAPLKASKVKDLKNTMIGQWELTQRKKKERAWRRPVKNVIKRWSFNEDGTGMLAVGASESTLSTNDFNWKLEGRNLVIGDDQRYFRVDKWLDDEMIWFNYQGSNFYIVERIN